MNCPYCGKPMERGKIPVYDRTIEAHWLPWEERIPWPYSEQAVRKKNGIILSVSAVLAIPGVESYICRDCKKGIFDLPNE